MAKPNSRITSGQLPTPSTHDLTLLRALPPNTLMFMTSFSHHARLSFCPSSFSPQFIVCVSQSTDNGHRLTEEPSPSKWLLAAEEIVRSYTIKKHSLSLFIGCCPLPRLTPMVRNETPHSLVPEPAHLSKAGSRFTWLEKQVLWLSVLLVLPSRFWSISRSILFSISTTD